MSQACDQRDFMDAMKIPRWHIDQHAQVPDANIDLAMDLIREEIGRELELAITAYKHLRNPAALADVLDAIVDGHYVLNQLANTFGLPVDAAHDLVHSSNMAKRQPDGTIHKRADGKVLKPEGWKPPDLLKLVEETIDQARNWV